MTRLSCPLCGARFDALVDEHEDAELAAFDDHLDDHISTDPPAPAVLPAPADLPLEVAA